MPKPLKKQKEIKYNPYFTVDSSNGLLGLHTCLRCGAALLIHSTEKAQEIHDKWHDNLTLKL